MAVPTLLLDKGQDLAWSLGGAEFTEIGLNKPSQASHNSSDPSKINVLHKSPVPEKTDIPNLHDLKDRIQFGESVD